MIPFRILVPALVSPDLHIVCCRTVLVNDNISYLYMIYQAVVMGASLLAPATVSTASQTRLCPENKILSK